MEVGLSGLQDSPFGGTVDAGGGGNSRPGTPKDESAGYNATAGQGAYYDYGIAYVSDRKRTPRVQRTAKPLTPEVVSGGSNNIQL